MTRTLESRKSNRTRLLAAVAAMASAVGILLVPAQMLPVANAACDDWVLGPTTFAFQLDGTGLDFDTYGWSGKSITALPSGAPAYAQMWTDPKSQGPVTGNINGRTITISANWTEGAAAGTTSTFTGQIADDGTVRGTSTGTPGGNTWTSDSSAKLPRCNTVSTPPSKGCPDGSSVQADQPCPVKKEPPKDAVDVTFDRDFAQWTVNVTSTADIPGKCTYTATSPGLPTTTRNFDIAAKGTQKLTVGAPPPFTTWHVVTTCTGTFEGQQVEFGRDVQDVSL